MRDGLTYYAPIMMRKLIWRLRYQPLPNSLAGDTYLCSYPRSGNTWTRLVLGRYFCPDDDINIDNLNRYVPDLHQTGVRDVQVQEVSPRVLKTHAYINTNVKRAIYIVRDPRDVVLSYYSYGKQRGHDVGDFSSYSRLWLKGAFWPGRWRDHVTYFKKMSSDSSADVMIIRYEDIHRDPLTNFTNMLDFLGHQTDASKLALAIESENFERYKSMQSIDRAGGQLSGAVEKWRRQMSAELQGEFLLSLEACLTDFGYDA